MATDYVTVCAFEGSEVVARCRTADVDGRTIYRVTGISGIKNRRLKKELFRKNRTIYFRTARAVATAIRAGLQTVPDRRKRIYRWNSLRAICG